MITKPNILLTGATGFIGKAILRELIRQDYEVMVLARAPERVTPAPQVEIVTCSLENITPDIAAAIRAFAPEVVIHAAWMGTENTNRNNPEFTFPNLQSTLKLFEISMAVGGSPLARKRNIAKILKRILARTQKHFQKPRTALPNLLRAICCNRLPRRRAWNACGCVFLLLMEVNIKHRM